MKKQQVKKSKEKDYFKYTGVTTKDLVKLCILVFFVYGGIFALDIIYVKLFVDLIITTGFSQAIMPVSITFVFVAAIQYFAYIFYNYYYNIINDKAQRNLLNKVFKDFINTKIENTVALTEGEVTNIVINASRNCNMIISHFSDKVGKLICAFLYLIFLFIASWQIALIVIVFTIVILFIYELASRMQYNASTSITNAYGEFLEATRENFEGNITVSVDNVKTQAENVFSKKNNKFTKSKIKELFIVRVVAVINYTLLTLLTALLYGIGGNLVIAGVMTVGNLYLSVQFSQSFTNMVSGYNAYLASNKGRCSNFDSSIYFSALTKDLDVKENDGKLPFVFEKSIEFKNISHYYKGELYLKNFNLKVAKHETIFIVQKNTMSVKNMFNILVGFYKQKDGAVLIDGVNTENINVKELRDNIGFVFKDPEIFNESFMFNLTMGKENLKERAIKVCKEVGLHNHIMSYENNYDTVISNNTKTLSLMEKQMLSMARVLITQKDILLVNNALNDMDDLHAGRFIQYIRYNLEGETCLIATNKTNLINDNDRVIFFGETAIKKDGTHGELLEENAEYREMVERYKAARR